MTDRIVLKSDGCHYFLEGKEVEEAAYRAIYPEPAHGSEGGSEPCGCGGWPMLSNALAVHPKNRKKAMEDAEAKGVPTEFNEQGQPVLRDRDHRKRYMQAYGFNDRDAGYGDAAPGYANLRGLPQRPESGPLSSRGY